MPSGSSSIGQIMTAKTDTLLRQAAEALANEKWAIAESLQHEAVELLRKQPADIDRLATELERLAEIHFTQQKFEKAGKEYAEVVELREKASPRDINAVLRALFQLAQSLFKAQDYEPAEVHMRRALSLAETYAGSPGTIAFYQYELGWLYYYVGKYREAEPYLLNALRLSEVANGPSHRQTIRVLVGLALLYKNCAELAKDPEPFFRRVLMASEGENELRATYVTNLCRLAIYMADCKRFEEADGLFSQLLTLASQAEDIGSDDLRWVLKECGEYFQSRGKGEIVASFVSEDDAKKVYRDMVQERLQHAEQKLSPRDPEFAQALAAAGNNALFEGNYQEAEPLLTRAYEACVEAHGPEGYESLHALSRICTIKRLLGKFDEAESAIQRAMEGAREHFSDDRLYPWILETFAVLKEAQGKGDEAESACRDAVREAERIFGFPSYETAEALYHQSACLLRIGKLGPAETAIRRVIEAMDVIAEVSDYEKSDYLATLASILGASGRQNEAAEFRSRADDLLEQAKRASDSDTFGCA